jgi:hypothetical protein
MKKRSNPAIIRPYASSKNLLEKNEEPKQNQQGINLSGGNFNIIIQKDENKIKENEFDREKELERLLEKEKNSNEEINNIGPKLTIKSKNQKNKDVGIIFNTINSEKNLETSIIATQNNNMADLSFNTSSKERIKLYANGKIELNGNIFLKGDQTVIKGDIIGIDNTLINGNITSNGNLIVCKDSYMENIIINNNLISPTLFIKNNENKENSNPLNSNYTLDNIIPVIYDNLDNTKKEIGLSINDIDQNYNLLVENNTINYIGIISILVNEIKNLKKEIEELKNKEINSKKAIISKEEIILEEINFFNM